MRIYIRLKYCCWGEKVKSELHFTSRLTLSTNIRRECALHASSNPFSFSNFTPSSSRNFSAFGHHPFLRRWRLTFPMITSSSQFSLPLNLSDILSTFSSFDSSFTLSTLSAYSFSSFRQLLSSLFPQLSSSFASYS